MTKIMKNKNLNNQKSISLQSLTGGFNAINACNIKSNSYLKELKKKKKI